MGLSNMRMNESSSIEKTAITEASSYTVARATGEPAPLTYEPPECSFLVICPLNGAFMVQ